MNILLRKPASPPAFLGLLAAALLASGCVGLSTVEVESGLEKLRFHPNMHVVQAGESVETVAFRYRLDPADVLALNPGARNGLHPGMRINVQPGTELAASVRRGGWPTSRPGVAPEVAVASPVPEPARPAPVPSVRDEALLGEPLSPTTVIATAPASNPSHARRLPELGIAARQSPAAAPVQARDPAAPRGDMAISQARWQAPANAREEIIPDDLGPLPDLPELAGSVEPQALYTPVPATTVPATSADGAWVWPTAGQIARGFAPERIDGQGIDIAGLPGQDVRAAAAGTVIYSGKSLAGDGGNLVILRHAGGLLTTYSHADRLFVTEDDQVLAGDPIASLGANEASESVLSFEVRRAGQAGPLDPLRFVTPR